MAERKHQTEEEESIGGTRKWGDVVALGKFPLDPWFLIGEMSGWDWVLSEAPSSLDSLGASKGQLTSSPVR